MNALQWLWFSSAEERARGSAHCWRRQPCSVTSLGSTAERPKLLIWLSSLRWFSSPNLVNVPLKVCLMRWNREKYIVLCPDSLIYIFFQPKTSHFRQKKSEEAQWRPCEKRTHPPPQLSRKALGLTQDSAHFLSSTSFGKRPQTPSTDTVLLDFQGIKHQIPFAHPAVSSLHSNSWAVRVRSALPYHPPQKGSGHTHNCINIHFIHHVSGIPI